MIHASTGPVMPPGLPGIVAPLRLRMTWCLPRQPVSVTVARQLLDTALVLLGVETDCREEITTVITETCTNAVRHAAGDEYRVDIVADQGRCVIDVTDNGPGLAPGLLGPAAVVTTDLTAECGRGLLIMQAYSDELHLLPLLPRGLTVRVVKNLTCGNHVTGQGPDALTGR